MNAPELKPIPRLTEVGDKFTGKVARCWPQRDVESGHEYVHFTFHGYDGELRIGAVGCMAKLMEMGFYEQPDRSNPDGVIRYDDVADEWLTFERVLPIRGVHARWRIVKAQPPAPPSQRPVASPGKPVASGPDNRRVSFAKESPVGRGIPRAPMDDRTPEEKRQAARDRYDAEAVRVTRELVPKIRKALPKGVKVTVSLDAIFAAAGSIVIAMEKRGCAT